MTALKYTFSFLTFMGCLCPFTWTSRAKRWLYKVYSLVILLFLQYILIMEVLDIIFNVEDQDQFCDNFSVTVAGLISIYKMFTFMGKRENILLLVNSLEKEPFVPMNKAEMDIKLKFDKAIQKNTIVFMLVLVVYLFVMWMSSLMRDVKRRQLAIQRVWVPFDYSPLILYAMTYSHQASCSVLLSVMHVANDTLISGLMVLIRCQLELLQHRLQNITGDHNQSVKACARHHECIYQFALEVNRHFQGILGFQFMASTPMVCLTLFRITNMSMGPELYEAIMYIICTMMQLSYYCWYGNEVKLKSLEVPDMIFSSNWPELNSDAKRMLLFIMQRSTFPIEFTSAHIVAVNLESFMAVMKTSYSLFNLLQSR
ncbi:odorant receptor Or1-like [Megalopta genalis]|uniref:odorant receptor Or1-like n=1 Tax=Megalopta genalis TaxID=115081 RepID=UPI003FD25DE1